MKGRLIWLNVLMAGLIVAAGLKIREQWESGRSQVDQVHRATVKPPPPTLPVLPPPPGPVTVAPYSDIAQKTLFSKERNPNIVIETAPPPPKPPMPALPILHGVMGLPSGRLALMSADEKTPSKGVRVGEKIGAFELAALSDEQISFKWTDQTVTRNVLEMMQQGREKTEPIAAAAQAPPAPSPQAAPPPPAGKFGPEIRPGIKQCMPGEASPEGTVADGYKKVTFRTPFGTKCEWQPVQ